MDEGTLCVHKIELVVKTSPGLSDGGSVGQHADGTLNLGQVTTGDDGWGLVVDTDLESSGAPVNELNGTLGLDGSNGGVDVLGDDVTTVQEAASHVLSVTRVTLNHLVSGLEARVGDLGNGQLLVVGLLGRNDRCIGDEREMNTRVGDQIGLELGKIDVERSIETERSRDRGDDLGNQSVKIGVGGALDVEVTAADIIYGLVINHEGTVRVLQGGVRGQDTVVRLNDSGGDLRGGVHRELKLGLLSVVDGETLQKEGTESGTGTTTERVEDEESLETSAVVGQLADSVEDEVDNLLSDGVVTTGVVVSGIFLSGNQLLGVEELTVGSGSDLIDDGGLQVDEDGTGNVLSGTSLREEGVERVVTTTDGLVRRHLTVGLDTVLEAVKLPAGVTDLD